MEDLDAWILQILWISAMPLGLFSFVHAAMQRPDAYTVTDKLTKPAWMGITGGSTLALVLFPFGGPGTIFWLAGLIAVLVYIVDVRPTVTEVQRGHH